MFGIGGLKDTATKKALALFEQDVSGRVKERIDLFKNLKPTDIQDDVKYAAIIIEPLWLYVKLQSGGVIGAVQQFTDVDPEGKFRKAMLHVRNELIKVEDGKVSLHPEFPERVGPTLIEALRA